MRILIYGINFIPELTGIGKYTGELAQFLSQRGGQVRVVTAPPYYPYWEIQSPYSGWHYVREQIDGIQVFRCPVWVLHLASFALSSLSTVFSQISWKPDVVICVAPAIFCAPAAWITARIARAKSWLHIQDFELEAAINLKLLPGLGFLTSFILKIEGFLLKRFDVVSTISQRMLERLHEKGVPDHKTYLLPNWVDRKVIFPLSHPSRIRQEIGAGPEKIVILYSGNLGQKQGLELLVGAAQVLQNENDIFFVICGNGSARSQLEEQAENLSNIRFIDLRPVEQLNELLNVADIHILLQRAETADLVMPSKLGGMLASGRPVIATASRGTELAAVIQETGLLIPPENLKELTQAIFSLAHDAPRREELGKRGLQFVRAHWEKQRVLDKLLIKLGYNTVLQSFNEQE
jgi:colanic acid biosynthesis glycosyl transferase WcaI